MTSNTRTDVLTWVSLSLVAVLLGLGRRVAVVV